MRLVHSTHEMYSQLIAHLNKEYDRRRLTNPRYSLRAFAKHLKVGHSTLLDLMAGKRRITIDTAKMIISRLVLTESEKRVLSDSLLGIERNDPPDESAVIPEETLRVISEWEHFAILALSLTENFSSDPAHIARKLCLPVTRVTRAIGRLESMQLLVKASGKLLPTHRQLKTSQDIPSVVLRRANLEHIRRAVKSLHDDPVEIRDISGTTFPMSAAALPEAKALIERFRRDLVKIAERSPCDEVYRLNVQLFPLTKER